MNEQTERGTENRMQEVYVIMNVCPVLCGIVGRLLCHWAPALVLPATLCNEALSLSLHEGERYSGTLSSFCRSAIKKYGAGDHYWRTWMGLGCSASHFWLSIDYISCCDLISCVKMGWLWKKLVQMWHWSGAFDFKGRFSFSRKWLGCWIINMLITAKHWPLWLTPDWVWN